MPATIVQSNTTAFKTRVIDPVTLDIIENALRNARVEMDTTLVRTAMSPGIREQGDAFPLIADHKGRMIVGQFGSYIGPFLDGFSGTVEDGDMIFLSDPYSVQGAISHNNDWLVLLPVFKDGRLIAYTSMFGHQSDIGGMVAGSMPIDATSIFQEGVRIPPVKIWKQGVYNEDLIKLVMHQTRTPEWCRADLNALIAACRVASRRVVEMAERFGDDVFVSACEMLLARNHRAMKALIEQAIGEDKVSFEDYICDDGLGYGPYKIKCTMWRENGRVVLDFAANIALVAEHRGVGDQPPVLEHRQQHKPVVGVANCAFAAVGIGQEDHVAVFQRAIKAAQKAVDEAAELADDHFAGVIGD